MPASLAALFLPAGDNAGTIKALRNDAIAKAATNTLRYSDSSSALDQLLASTAGILCDSFRCIELCSILYMLG